MVTTPFGYSFGYLLLDIHLKIKVVTTSIVSKRNMVQLDIHLKIKVVTTDGASLVMYLSWIFT